MTLSTDLLASTVARFRDYRTLGERALAQCSDADLTRVIAPGSNSIAVIVKHLRGNMRSRWTDFLTTDGEKPDRDRDGEFEDDAAVDSAKVMRWWEEGWRVCLDSLSALQPDDLERIVTIRGEPHTVVDAVLRGLAHTSYHVGQVVLLAKAFRGEEWATLSIPRGGSAEYTRRTQEVQSRR